MSDSLKPYANLSINEIEELEKDSSIQFEIYLFSKKEGEVGGNIKAQIENQSLFAYSEIYLDFLKDYIPPEEEIPITKTCSEMNGKICSKNEECSGEQVNAKDTVCCLENCEEIKKDNSGVIIGIGILIIVGAIIIWFFMKKYRGAKKPINLLDVAKKSRPQINSPPLRKIEQPALRKNFSQPVKMVQQRPKPIIRYVEKEVEKIVEKYVR